MSKTPRLPVTRGEHLVIWYTTNLGLRKASQRGKSEVIAESARLRSWKSVPPNLLFIKVDMSTASCLSARLL